MIRTSARRLAPFAGIFSFLVSATGAPPPAMLNVPGSFATIQAAVSAANPGDTIQVAAGTYTESVTITKSLTITGAGATTIVTGPTAAVGVAQAGAFIVTGAVTVTISNLAAQNSVAQGGIGGTGGGAGGGGGGAAFGGALFVGTLANVTISNVIFQNNAANGGAGGPASGAAEGVCGGGNSSVGSGGAPCSGAAGGFGGGGGGLPSTAGNGGNGGFGGGGGGGSSQGRAIAFIGGLGGFGAGAGGAAPADGTGGGGGGGAGFGGAVFVQQGGFLSIGGTSTITSNTALDGGAGAGYNGGNTGNAATLAVGGIFLQGNDGNNGGSGAITFSPALGQTQNDADGISDQTGLGGTGSNLGSWSLVMNGAGLLVMNASNNNYTGTTSINAGATEVVGVLGLTTGGAVTVASGAVLGGGGTVQPNVLLSPGGILQPGLAAGIPETLNMQQSLTWNGSTGTPMMNYVLYAGGASDKVATVGTLTKGSAGTFPFNFQNTGVAGQTYTLMTFASTGFTSADFSYINLAPGLTGLFAVGANSITFTVSQVPTTTGVSPSPNPVNFGQSETLTATVTSGVGTPTGTVTFVDTTTSTTLATVALNGSGQAGFSLSTLSVGAHNITATYNPPANTWAGSFGLTSVTVNQPATHYSVTAASPQTSGTAFNVTVTALDSSNATVSGYTGTVHFTSSDGAAVLPANATLTGGTGTFSVTLKTAGNQTVTATDTVTASITGTTNAIVVNPGAATVFSVSATSPETAGASFNFTVTAKDANNNTATGYTGTVHFTSTDGLAILPANATLTSGAGTFSATLKTAGNQTITATDTTTGTITGTSNAIVVSAGAATTLTVSAAVSAAPGTAFNVTVTAKDAFNNTASGYADAVHFTSTDGAAFLPANATLTSGVGTFPVTLNTQGSQTITATDTVTAGITGTSGAISVAMPASITVTNLNDAGSGSLRAAISTANASPGGGAITFTVTGAITLTTALPALTQSMSITGPGPSSLTVNAGGTAQVFNVTSGITVSISGVTITNGHDTGSGGGGIANSGNLALSACVVTGNLETGNGLGGGIFNNGTITINQCTVSNNDAAGSGGSSFGGGLFNASTATITNSTFSANTADGGNTAGGQGGGIFNGVSSPLTITGSTITGNKVTDASGAGLGGGGAIYNQSTTVIKNSTISGNSQNGTLASDIGGGIFNSGSAVTLNNTILSGNTDAGASLNPDAHGAFTGGNNLIGVATGLTGITNGASGNQLGTSGSPLNPQLTALANNGGPTQTLLPGGNSPVLGAGSTAGVQPTDTDQRGAGFLRLANGVIDIGAVQLQGIALAAAAGTPQTTGATMPFVTALAATATESCGACTSPVQGVTVTFTAPGTGASGTFAGGVNTAVTNSSGLATAAAFTANSTVGGPYTVAASATTPDQATAAGASFSLTNAILSQTITGFGAIGAQTYGAVFSITGVSATSGLTVMFTSNTMTICTVSGAAVTIVSGTGTCSITASQSGSSTYSAAPIVNQTFMVTKAPLTVSVASTSKAYGAILPTFTTNSVTGLTNGDTVGTTITIALSSTGTASSAVGSYPITAMVGGTALGNYTLANNPGSLTVSAVGLTVAVAPQTKVYGAALPTLTSAVTGLVNGDTVGGTITVSYNTATAGSPVGDYPITATVGGSAIGNYMLTNTPNVLSITRAVLTVSANNISKLSGAALPTLTASITGFVNGDAATVVSGTPLLTTTATPASSVGSYPITVTAGTLSATNYTFTFVNGTLTVIAQPPPPPATISVLSGSGQSGVQGTAWAAPLVAIVTDANGLPVSNVYVTFAVTSGTATLSGVFAQTAFDGTAQITATPTSAGTIVISATVTGVNSAAVFTENGLSGAATPQLSVLPSTLSFTVVQGGDDPLPASIAVSNTGVGTLQWTASDSGNPAWLSLGATSGATPTVLPATIVTAGLAPGNYQSTITVISGSLQRTVAVALSVVASTPPQFSLTPGALVVNTVAGSTAAISRAINVGNGGGGTLTWNAAAGTGTTWLSVSPASGSSASGKAPSTATVQLNPSGLAAGQYLGNIAFSATGAPPADVAVVLNVAAQPNLISSVPALSFRGAVGTSFTAQTIPVTTTTGAGVAFTASDTVTSGASWLTLTGASGSTPASISASANTSGLAAGYYVGYISVQSAAAPNTLLVPVVLDLGSATVAGRLSASPGGVLLTNGALSQSIALTSDSGSFSWNAVALASSGGSWLTVSPATGSSNGSITVSANLTGLQPGSYTGQIAVAGTGTSNTELIIPVTLIVSSGSTAVTSTNTLQPVQPAGDFVANLDVPVPLQATILSPTGTPVTGATVQVAFTTGDPPVVLTDVGGGTYTGAWSPMQAGPVSLLFTSVTSPSGVVTGAVSATVSNKPAFTVAGAVSSASFVSGAPLVVGSIATLFGQNLATQAATSTSFPLPTALGGVSVTINGISAPLYYASSGQINFFVPYELAGQTTATIVVSTAAGVAEVTGVPIAPELPGLYLSDAAGDASAVHLTGIPVSAAAPAAGGETIEIFATSLGPVTNTPGDGLPAPGSPFAMDQITPVVTIGGVSAQVLYAGLAPGFAGLYQLNVVVPAGLPTGPNALTIAAGPLVGNTAVLQVH